MIVGSIKLLMLNKGFDANLHITRDMSDLLQFTMGKGHPLFHKK